MTERAAAEATEFLDGGGWRTRFEGEVLEVGRRLARRRAVAGLAVEWLGGDNLVLSAGVSDEDGEVHCEVTVWPDKGIWQLESSCSCAQRCECVHAAALLLSLPSGASLGDLLAGDRATGAQLVDPAGPGAARQPAALPDEELERLRAEPDFLVSFVREPVTTRQAQRFHETLAGRVPRRWLVGQPTIRYGDHEVAPLTPADEPLTRVHDPRTGTPLLLERDASAEAAALSALRRSGLVRLAAHPLWGRLHHGRPPAEELWVREPSGEDPAHFWAVFRRRDLPELERHGWQVDFPAQAGHRVIPADPAEWEARLEGRGGSWFSLSVGFAVEGRTHNLLPLLARLLGENILEESLDRPNSATILVPLPDAPAGEVLELPLGRLRRILRQLFATLHPGRGGTGLEEDGSARLHALDAAALAGIEELGIEEPVELAELRRVLTGDGGEQSHEVAVPERLTATLRPYQREGYGWMQFLARHDLHGVLADDMGLGKTLQTIAHLLAEVDSGRSEGRPSLVVAPTSVVPNWLAEVRRFAPGLQVMDATGPRRRNVLPHLHHADLVVTSYALLHRDLKRLGAQEFHLAVLDEAQYIKNPAARATQAARQLQARHRLCLSGTPIENHLGELWSQFAFLQPGFLGSQEQFNSRFRQPIEKQGDEQRRELLRARVAPLILRRHKSAVARDLPPKTELIHSIELSDAQKDLYEAVRAGMDKQVRQALAIHGEDGVRMLFLSALLKLRQVCCDPRLLDPPPGGHVPSAKLETALELVEQLVDEGSHILLFSQFTSMLDLLAAELKQRRIDFLQLTGASQNRGRLVERFQSGRIPLFLISLKAGGTGLNLTRADTVIHYDPWWNPAVEAQATDRAYRIGQERPVFVHKLLCRDSVEERIHKLQRDKAELADAVLAGAHRAVRFDPKLFEALLAPLEWSGNAGS